MRSTIALVLAASLLAAHGSAAQEAARSDAAQEIPAGQRERIAKLMALMGADAMQEQVSTYIIQQLFAALRAQNPAAPADAMEIVESETLQVLSEHRADLRERIVPIYARHFTGAELDELIAFYQTPTGQKAIREVPVLLQELIPVSQQWAVALEPELTRRIQARLEAAGVHEAVSP